MSSKQLNFRCKYEFKLLTKIFTEKNINSYNYYAFTIFQSLHSRQVKSLLGIPYPKSKCLAQAQPGCLRFVFVSEHPGRQQINV